MDGKPYVAIYHALYVLELEVVPAVGAEFCARKDGGPYLLWGIWDILCNVQMIKPRIAQHVSYLIRQGGMKFCTLRVIADEVGSVNLGGFKIPRCSPKPPR